MPLLVNKSESDAFEMDPARVTMKRELMASSSVLYSSYGRRYTRSRFRARSLRRLLRNGWSHFSFDMPASACFQRLLRSSWCVVHYRRSSSWPSTLVERLYEIITSAPPNTHLEETPSRRQERRSSENDQPA